MSIKTEYAWTFLVFLFICILNKFWINFSDISKLEMVCDGRAWSNPELPPAFPLSHYSPITPPNALFNSNQEKSSNCICTFLCSTFLLYFAFWFPYQGSPMHCIVCNKDGILPIAFQPVSSEFIHSHNSKSVCVLLETSKPRCKKRQIW